MQDIWLSLTKTKEEEWNFNMKTTNALPDSQLSKITMYLGLKISLVLFIPFPLFRSCSFVLQLV